jgi:hypothetical protein
MFNKILITIIPTNKVAIQAIILQKLLVKNEVMLVQIEFQSMVFSLCKYIEQLTHYIHYTIVIKKIQFQKRNNFNILKLLSNL